MMHRNRRFRRGTCLLIVTVAGGLTFAQAPRRDPLPARVEFNRDIRPILSDNCFHCHGPDKSRRKADLRLDTEEGAFADLGGHKAITSGDLKKSEVYLRLVHDNPKKRMPPTSSGKKLSDRELQLIARWIEQGARWQPHWAFIPPSRVVPPPPSPGYEHWVRNPIDQFILARLRAAGLPPSPEADRITLVRRVTLDLTGLPPNPRDIDSAINDPSPDWYDRVVDRLLGSPRYGERMAARWLDAARYADTNGYQDDGERFMWRWRDWVIDAFNRNLPFDQFTIEQIAGDLLPGATLEQVIATGFNRNHRINAEGGIIPEEYAVEYVADRVETIATVWLGLTLTCARCHSHKYDPILQREFYQLFAFFNNVPEHGRGIKYGNSPPYIAAPTRDQQDQLKGLDARIREAEDRLARLAAEIASSQAEWEKTVDPTVKIDGAPRRKLAAHWRLDGDTGNEVGPVQTIEGLHRRAGVFQQGKPAYAPGRFGLAGDFDGKRFLNVGDEAKFGFDDRFTFTAWILPRGDGNGIILSRMADTSRSMGYNVVLEHGRVHVNLVVRWLDDALRVQTDRKLEPDRWHHLAVSYDGTKVASSVKVHIDGKAEKLNVLLDALNQSFQVKEPFRIGAGGGGKDGFHGLIDDLRVYSDVLEDDEIERLAVPETIPEIIQIPPKQRTPAQAGKLRAYFLEEQAAAHLRQAYREPRELRWERARFIESLPTVMVMAELPRPRETHLLIRGLYDKPGEKVSPGVPGILPPIRRAPGVSPGSGQGTDAPRSEVLTRLDFARWLVDARNPLTARVTANRFWQMYFGTGLVKTVDDFGAQGEWPSHPELLDWLANEFVRSGWDIKAMQRLIVTSAAYRQSSRVTRTLLENDPENRLLSRGPRLRLPAETIRDQALAGSGLLVERIGGPSVKPYQPAGLWKELSGGKDYVADKGVNLYRRSIYTFWKRTVTPPAMLTFDASMRETCVVREHRTNTPLQALNLMNDVTYVEPSRVLAERAMAEAGPSPADRITLVFRRLLSRPPRPAELEILLGAYRSHLSEYQSNPETAAKLVSAGEYPRDSQVNVVELAACTAVAGMILNLDEAITKE
jgi:hypothetical protein